MSLAGLPSFCAVMLFSWAPLACQEAAWARSFQAVPMQTARIRAAKVSTTMVATSSTMVNPFLADGFMGAPPFRKISSGKPFVAHNAPGIGAVAGAGGGLVFGQIGLDIVYGEGIGGAVGKDHI